MHFVMHWAEVTIMANRNMGVNHNATNRTKKHMQNL